jgi:hypothetical protein
VRVPLLAEPTATRLGAASDRVPESSDVVDNKEPALEVTGGLVAEDAGEASLVLVTRPVVVAIFCPAQVGQELVKPV